ncbi:MAG: TIGR00282 family metallophosphoesterase [Patescibacteria group bacterium]
MKILFIGDIVGSPGRKAVEQALPKIKSQNDLDLTVANAENLAHGRGITEGTITDMKLAGVDFFTGGDHLFWNKDTSDYIDALPLIRPANYPEGTPGKGYAEIDLGKRGKVLLINLLGRTFLNERVDDPFRKADEILTLTAAKKYEAVIVDFHAEATSEKAAMGFYLDGRVTAVLGTHTHVPTCDALTLPKGTFFVSDVGMSGNVDSVLGVKKEIILRQYLSGMNQKFEWEESGRKAFRSVLLDLDKMTVERVDRNLY